MRNEADTNDHAEPRAPATRDDASAGTTRRGFLGNVGRKASYIAPVVLIMTASQAALAASPSCASIGRACIVNEDCCSGMCDGSMQCI